MALSIIVDQLFCLTMWPPDKMDSQIREWLLKQLPHEITCFLFFVWSRLCRRTSSQFIKGKPNSNGNYRPINLIPNCWTMISTFPLTTPQFGDGYSLSRPWTRAVSRGLRRSPGGTPHWPVMVCRYPYNHPLPRRSVSRLCATCLFRRISPPSWFGLR